MSNQEARATEARHEFPAQLPPYFGLGVLDVASVAPGSGGLNATYRWRGTDVYHVTWKLKSGAWTIRAASGGPLSTGQDFTATARERPTANDKESSHD